MIFGIAIDVYTVVSIAVVSAATFLYAQNPVVNKGKLNDDGKVATSPSAGGSAESSKLTA